MYIVSILFKFYRVLAPNFGTFQITNKVPFHPRLPVLTRVNQVPAEMRTHPH